MTSPDPPTPPKRRLKRSADERMIAGVAGGVAEHFDLDPALVRIAFAVLTLFGGAGLALYAVGAFVIPAEDGAPPLSTTAKAAIGIIAVAAVLSVPFSGGAALVLIVPAAIGVLVWRAFGGRADPRLVRAALVVVAVAGALLAGVAAAVGAAFGGGTVIAALVIVSGLALVAAGLRGGARWLIVPALLLAVPASVVAAADLRLEGGVGDRDYRPSSVSDLRSSYRLGAGALSLDLRDVRLEPGQEVAVTARVGVGDLQVTVPDGVCVQTTAHLGVGGVDVLGRTDDGIDVDTERGGIAAAGQPVLRVHLKGGIAALRVNRRPTDLDHDHHDFDSPVVSDGCEG
jgi:phage shock protein PspC (stress-responsive transcriptional regulator)